jgi:hypothetical protein
LFLKLLLWLLLLTPLLPLLDLWLLLLPSLLLLLWWLDLRLRACAWL